MTDTDDRATLEQQLRNGLHKRAVHMFPEHTAPPAASLPPHRRNWWPALAAAALIAALAIGTTTLARSPERRSSGASPTKRHSADTPIDRAQYPEAAGLGGVRVIELPATTPSTVQFTNTFPPAKTLAEGQAYPFTLRVRYGPAHALPVQTLILGISARGAALNCPPPFLVHPGFEYVVSCTVVPAHTGAVTAELTTTSGQPASSDTAPFSSARLSGLGNPPVGQRTILSTTSRGNRTLTLTPRGGAGLLYASCIGGGTIGISMPGHGGFTLDCTGDAAGTRLPSLGTTVRISGVVDQQWRVAVFGH